MNKYKKTITNKNNIIEQSENVTKYGEFVSSYFAWLTLEQQKKKANKMENITKKN